MNLDKLFSLLSPKNIPQVLSQESQQAYQSKVDTAKAENKMIKEKVVNPFFSFADKSFKKIMEVLNPGESYVAPALKKIGVNPILAGGIGLGVDILAPGPGELGRVAKVGKEVKVGSELLQEARKYKSAEEFVKAQGKPLFHGSSEEIKVFKNIGERGAYLTPDKKMANIHASFASNFGKNAGTGKIPTVTEAFIKPKKIYKIPKGENSLTGVENDMLIEAPQYFPDEIRKIKSEGFDAIQSSDGRQLLVFNPEQIKTKSQLTDIWKQANKKTK